MATKKKTAHTAQKKKMTEEKLREFIVTETTAFYHKMTEAGCELLCLVSYPENKVSDPFGALYVRKDRREHFKEQVQKLFAKSTSASSPKEVAATEDLDEIMAIIERLSKAMGIKPQVRVIELPAGKEN